MHGMLLKLVCEKAVPKESLKALASVSPKIASKKFFLVRRKSHCYVIQLLVDTVCVRQPKIRYL